MLAAVPEDRVDDGRLGVPYGLVVRAGDSLAMPTPIGPAIGVFPILDAPVLPITAHVLTDEPTLVLTNGR